MSLPKIRIFRRRTAVKVTATLLADGSVRVTVPVFYDLADPINKERVMQMVNRLLKEAPRASAAMKYTPATVIRFEEGRITFRRTFLVNGRVTASPSEGEAVEVLIGGNLDLSAPAVQMLVNRMVLRIAHVKAFFLILRTREIASSLGLSPSGVEIGRGTRTLGTCHADGRIVISAICLFLPHDLRDYIICHELAHLTEMNHSPRFHALCDSYCGGREKELSARLKAFDWPIYR